MEIAVLYAETTPEKAKKISDFAEQYELTVSEFLIEAADYAMSGV